MVPRASSSLPPVQSKCMAAGASFDDDEGWDAALLTVSRCQPQSRAVDFWSWHAAADRAAQRPWFWRQPRAPPPVVPPALRPCVAAVGNPVSGVTRVTRLSPPVLGGRARFCGAARLTSVPSNQVWQAWWTSWLWGERAALGRRRSLRRRGRRARQPAPFPLTRPTPRTLLLLVPLPRCAHDRTLARQGGLVRFPDCRYHVDFSYGHAGRPRKTMGGPTPLCDAAGAAQERLLLQDCCGRDAQWPGPHGHVLSWRGIQDGGDGCVCHA